MFKISNAAAVRLAEKLEQMEAPHEKVVRFCVDSEGLHLRLSKKRPGDTQFAHEGKTVLVVDDNLFQRLASRTLDVKQTETGDRLSLVHADRDGIEA
jgi:Fe-S cluster assembly iron-binding protein IscA